MHCFTIRASQHLKLSLFLQVSYFNITTSLALPSNQCLSPEDYAVYIQGHRQIENNLHWVKDVLFSEDKCRLKKPSQALVMGILRSMALNLLRLSGIDSCTEGFMFMQARFQHPWLLLQTF